jgi:hypothetical protein
MSTAYISFHPSFGPRLSVICGVFGVARDDGLCPVVEVTVVRPVSLAMIAGEVECQRG